MANIFFVRVAGACLLGLELMRTAATAGCQWNVQVLDATGVAAGNHALAIAPDGQPAVCYVAKDPQTGRSALKYAWFDGDAWLSSPVHEQRKSSPRPIGLGSSLAFSRRGQPAVSYSRRTATGGDLWYAEFDGQQWQKQPVDAAAHVADDTVLKFTPDGRPAIAYTEPGCGAVKYAEQLGATWQVATVAAHCAADYISLAFTRDGRPAISYFNSLNSDLKYAERTDAGWLDISVHATGWGRYTSLTFSPDGQPAIAYWDDANAALKFVERNANGAWLIFTIASVVSSAGSISLAFPPGENAHPAISYYDFANRTLQYAIRKNNLWTITPVETAVPFIVANSLAFKADGFPAICYYDQFHGHLKYAQYDCQ